MCLTEPQCGSDLAQVATMAITEDEGKSYKVSGTKIFISAGDHDFGDGAGTADGQVIHCVLARTPGAPEGTKGISLFLVPKFLVNEDGTLGELNNGSDKAVYTYFHRALLFKVLADQVSVPSALIRGEYNRAYNVVYLASGMHVVDVTHEPGHTSHIQNIDTLHLATNFFENFSARN